MKKIKIYNSFKTNHKIVTQFICYCLATWLRLTGQHYRSSI